jgi:hypothetical protein
MSLLAGEISMAVLMAVLALWILGPLRHPMRATTFADDARWQELVALKHALYRSILDLEFDQAVGKVSEADYAFLRRQQEGEALAVMAEMETLTAGPDGDEPDFDTLEAEIAAARQRLQAHP